ncbi:helix-turn-helix transcriptional regulator [Streptomyces synnematoformans]|uniref:Helix-turn-helix transcriptional regulator n=1 Tax=Streptomyces synnematoformans TaxID=415721 RepID=A0ABP5IWV8_9ACTN
MAVRKTPTQRQQRLGSELRKIRTSAGMSTTYAAGLLGLDSGKISYMESGQRTISAERLRTLACNCDCTDEKYVEALVEMTRRESKGWWEQYRGSLPHGLLDIAELEAHATRMRAANTVHIPGVLQTSDHALAVFRAVLPPLPRDEIGLRLAHRAKRQDVLVGGDPTAYRAVVHEAALRMQFGGRRVARAQLEYLLDMSERENVVIQVMPFDHGSFPGAGQNLLYAEGPVPQLDTVQIDNSHGPDFLHAEGQLAKYRTQLDRQEEAALPPDESRDFIREIAHRL